MRIIGIIRIYQPYIPKKENNVEREDVGGSEFSEGWTTPCSYFKLCKPKTFYDRKYEGGKKIVERENARGKQYSNERTAPWTNFKRCKPETFLGGKEEGGKENKVA